MIPNFDTLLDRYAELLIKVGLNLQPGQRLLIDRGTPLEAAALVRQVARQAYRAGAALVSASWHDAALERIRLDEAALESLDEVAQWQHDALLETINKGGALLALRGDDPDIFTGVAPERLSRAIQANTKAGRPASELLSKQASNWLVAGASTPAWAAKLFPGRPSEEQVDLLWEAIFKACRVYSDDPVAEWRRHLNELKARADYMNAKRYQALHFQSPGTDLTVELAEGHHWKGGGAHTLGGQFFVANMPTEEIFTMPHRLGVNGVVRATKPLNMNGLVEDFSVRFENGRAVQVQARVGEELLRQRIAQDEGAAHLGEVALVPHGSPISQSNVLFYNTLFDENASCHLAFGRAYRDNMENGADVPDEEYSRRGGNNSLIHIDFMVGSGETDIDGITASGEREAVFRAGEWAVGL